MSDLKPVTTSMSSLVGMAVVDDSGHSYGRVHEFAVDVSQDAARVQAFVLSIYLQVVIASGSLLKSPIAIVCFTIAGKLRSAFVSMIFKRAINYSIACTAHHVQILSSSR